MEKRFELFEEDLEYWIHDYKTNKNYTEFDLCWITDLLNEQDEKIKELQYTIVESNQTFWHKFDDEIPRLKKEYHKAVAKLNKSVAKLKQSQNSKAIEILGKVKSYFCEEEVDGDDIKTGDWIYTKDVVEVAEYIDNQITELRKVNCIGVKNGKF